MCRKRSSSRRNIFVWVGGMRVLYILPRSASLSLFDSSQSAGARIRKSHVNLERFARLCTIKSALCRVPDILCGGRVSNSILGKAGNFFLLFLFAEEMKVDVHSIHSTINKQWFHLSSSSAIKCMCFTPHTSFARPFADAACLLLWTFSAVSIPKNANTMKHPVH